MKIVLLISLIGFLASADQYVRGYYRKNGTYVHGYTRSSPDSHKWNNYGSGKGSTYTRDKDHDGIYNQYDTDDDNDGIHDDLE